MVTGRVPAGSRLRLGERDVRVAADGRFVFGLDRDAPAEITLQLVLADGRDWQETHPVRSREYRIQRVTGIAERIMKPSEADQQRIAEEARLAAAARTRDDDRTDFLQSFIWPTTGPVTGVYGSQRYYNGVPGRPHYGVDVGVPTGTPVVAPAAGIVTLAHPDMFYSGGTLIIDHGHGISSTLMHLSAVLVRVGERVEQGQLVARTGASGRASGPHLDWRMNWFGERIDPQLLVPPMPQ
jgi:murein DD-endopeptidase MepM/ murein hydrolase activator NlpD